MSFSIIAFIYVNIASVDWNIWFLFFREGIEPENTQVKMLIAKK